MASFLVLVQRVLRNIDEQSVSTLSGATGMAARCMDWVNEAIGDIYSRKMDWTWQETSGTITLSAGTSAYALPSDADEDAIRLINNAASGRKLDYIDYEEWYRYEDQLITDTSSGDYLTGSPSQYTIHNQQVIVWPTPAESGTLNIFYSSEFTELAASADTCAIPSKYDHVIRRGATWLAKLFLGDTDAQIEQGLYEQGIRNMITQDRRYGDRTPAGTPERGHNFEHGELD